MKKNYCSPEFEFRKIVLIKDSLVVSVSQPQSEDTLPSETVDPGPGGPGF